MLKKLSVLFMLTVVFLSVQARSAFAWGFPMGATDWTAVQTSATTIHEKALVNAAQAVEIQEAAAAIQANESDLDVLDWANQMMEMAEQMETDANAIAATADDINTRIDNSESTTLALSADILRMAGEIGVMADRILTTEGEIGVMADRIVESETLISDSSLTLAENAATIILTGMNSTSEIITSGSNILTELGS
jgi:hypothetical protein